ncbi:MAG TPA: hypothetical protein PLN56_06655 [Methanoregulaceae archaeon]|nr:MAG: hypothetical protein IPI71_07170 [Methanolinea sp.]HON81943.1 hypothetical protein [Methanoregulaceae archaeon]HPD10659.1 hypothetical protein [Methanoregulaceae archaeon]HRT15788.1 hypothetical protein [Methanoregulaceae archaeon]HRU31302.1 hypothetical protein [Methanoregulaceae archaeon]
MQKRVAFCFFMGIFSLLLLLQPSVAADVRVTIYETDFSTDPGWITNNPSHYYWDVQKEAYHFQTEGGTNGYSFVPVGYQHGSFTLEYDLLICSISKNGAVRFGMTSADMDLSKGANVFGVFSYGQYGRIMAIRVIDQNNHLHEKTSQHNSYCGNQPNCVTKQYEENITYRVAIRYNEELTQADIEVTNKDTGELLWGYFVPIGTELHYLNRLAITTKGDYLVGNTAEGYIDNIVLYTYVPITPTTVVTTLPTTAPTTIPSTVPTPTPTKSPAWAAIVVTSLCAAAWIAAFFRKR